MGIFGGSSRAAPQVTPRVVVKFAPALRLSQSEAAEAEHAAAHGHAWDALCLKFPGITLKLFFTALDAATLERLEQRAVAAGTRPRLHLLFRDRGPAPGGSRWRREGGCVLAAC